MTMKADFWGTVPPCSVDFLGDSPSLIRSLFCGTISSLSGIESRGDEGTKGPSLDIAL